jgi:hypothetical protein
MPESAGNRFVTSVPRNEKCACEDFALILRSSTWPVSKLRRSASTEQRAATIARSARARAHESAATFARDLLALHGVLRYTRALPTRGFRLCTANQICGENQAKQ